MNTKEIVDKYLTENFEEIDAQRVLNKEFRVIFFSALCFFFCNINTGR